MTQISSPNSEALHAAAASHVNVNRITVSDRTLSIVALVMGAMGLMAGFWGIDRANRADQSAELLRLEVHGFKNALHAHGIHNTSPHLPGESP